MSARSGREKASSPDSELARNSEVSNAFVMACRFLRWRYKNTPSMERTVMSEIPRWSTHFKCSGSNGVSMAGFWKCRRLGEGVDDGIEMGWDSSVQTSCCHQYIPENTLCVQIRIFLGCPTKGILWQWWLYCFKMRTNSSTNARSRPGLFIICKRMTRNYLSIMNRTK